MNKIINKMVRKVRIPTRIEKIYWKEKISEYVKDLKNQYGIIGVTPENFIEGLFKD